MKYIPLLVAMLALCACDKSATEKNLAPLNEPAQTTANPHDLKALVNELSAHDDTPETTIKPIITPDGKVQIDWTLVDTKEARADVATYEYPLALDSMAVKNYAKAYNITDKQAQHSLVVGMASPEVLGKILDQLQDGKYLSHRLTDGADMTLIITTTPDVVGERHEYVFADTYGRGLVLPVVIEPKQ